MAWQFWENQEMTVPADGLNAVFTSVNGNPAPDVRGVVYWGNTDARVKIQDAGNPNVEPIKIYTAQALGEPQRNTELTFGQQFQVGEYIYIVRQAGTTDSNIPTYPAGIGSTVSDGYAMLENIYKAHKIQEVKLSLSESGLNTAIAGGELSLAPTINGGASIAIYYQITNSNPSVFNTGNYNQLCLAITNYVESPVDSNGQ